jgi:hypothetical protein
MFTAKELRIGNWVESTISEPLQVSEDDISNFKKGHDRFVPIDLTPEILTVAAGFEKTGNEYYTPLPTTPGNVEVQGIIYTVVLRDKGLEGFGVSLQNKVSEGTQVDLPNIRIIKYVHELQNLYFSCVGEELPIPTIS